MTDEELRQLADKVGMAIKLENPKARYACYFFTGKSSEDETLRSSVTVKATPIDMLAAIDSLLGKLEEMGVSRDGTLMNLLKKGPLDGEKERW